MTNRRRVVTFAVLTAAMVWAVGRLVFQSSAVDLVHAAPDLSKGDPVALQSTPGPLPVEVIRPPALSTQGVIWQPPTRTPQATDTPGGPTPAVDTDNNSGPSPFRQDRINESVLAGVLIALAGFFAYGFYSAIRAARRGELQVWLHEIDDGLIKPILRGRRKS